ncbi:MAG: hypothetical protein QQN58_05930 [Nitrosopumilus sp.]|nr:hypothetical protein [Nitrososphaerota archaeon]
MLNKSIVLLVILLVFSISFTTVFALTDLQKTTISDPRLVNTFGIPIGNNVNIDQQFQISADITNNQEKSQNFVYLVQIKNNEGFVVSLGWISGQLTPDQKLSPSLSWTPNESGEFTTEIYVWEGLINHKAISQYTTLQINVS